MAFHFRHEMHETPLPAVQPLTADQKAILMDNWAFHGGYIMNHDGKPKEYLNTTVNIKENPLLRKAIEVIRDGYFELSNGILQLERQHKFLHRRRNHDLKHSEDEVHFDMVVHNSNSLARLQEQDYGFSREEKAEILKDQPVGAETGKPLSPEDAYHILNKIVGRSLDCFEAISGHSHRVDVPFSFNVASADEIYHHHKGQHGR